MLERLADERFDVLVVGGGITGAGVALDAASRGLRTALVERHDFASGTSSKSSKMVHGGLRYLQQHDFRLVYEALHERQRLLDNASHLVSPLPFLIPLFGREGMVNRNVARTYSTALWLYDLTGGLRIGKRHQRITRSAVEGHLPTLRTDHLAAGFLYFDARADDARLTLSIVRTAALDFGAVAANYVEVTGLLHDSSGAVRGAKVRPTAPGPGKGRGGGNGGTASEIEVSASVVVNATGVWADDIRALDEATHPHSLRPAKGIHLSFPRSKIPADIAAVLPVRRDRRSVFMVPWPDGGDVYIGTTDTDFDGPLDDPLCTPEDVDYLIDAASALLTTPVTRDDVTGIWAGLRPLLAPSNTGRAPSARTADLSRRHKVRVSPSGLVTVTGGKLTTYRRMAEDTVDAAAGLLGSTVPGVASKSVTARLAIRGSSDASRLEELGSAGAAKDSGVDEATWSCLIGRYGTEAPDVLALAKGDTALLAPLVEGLPHLRVEALWAVRHEMALTLDDLLARRTRAVIRRAADTVCAAGEIAQLVAAELGMSTDDATSQAAAFAEATRREWSAAGLDLSRP